jgi:ribosomal protein S18 acetylase RimI-like enzyme
VDAYQFQWRGDFTNDELNRLHAEAFNQTIANDDWVLQVNRHSLGWVTAREGVELVGFVNVPWDGGFHAFILDTIVRTRAQRQGIGSRLVEMAAAEARAAGCGCLHVDFKDELRPFYLESCGFTSTAAGLLWLVPAADDAG